MRLKHSCTWDEFKEKIWEFIWQILATKTTRWKKWRRWESQTKLNYLRHTFQEWCSTDIFLFFFFPILHKYTESKLKTPLPSPLLGSFCAICLYPDTYTLPHVYRQGRRRRPDVLGWCIITWTLSINQCEAGVGGGAGSPPLLFCPPQSPLQPHPESAGAVSWLSAKGLLIHVG